VLLSALACPGAGQIYKGHRLRGILMVITSVALLVTLTVKIFMIGFEMMMNMPPDQMFLDYNALAHKILYSKSVILKGSGYGFLAVYVYGILDAAIARPKEP